MSSFTWSHPERRDLYLASRVLAGDRRDGDWLQWASDIILQDLELYEDPKQGVGTWLFQDEANLANDLGEHLWAIVSANPFEAGELLLVDVTLRPIASQLILRMKANGRGAP